MSIEKHVLVFEKMAIVYQEDVSTFLHRSGFFLSLGERRWSLNQDATTQGSPSPLTLLDTDGFSSSISQT